jgi:hypothetical protein
MHTSWPHSDSRAFCSRCNLGSDADASSFSAISPARHLRAGAAARRDVTLRRSRALPLQSECPLLQPLRRRCSFALPAATLARTPQFPAVGQDGRSGEARRAESTDCRGPHPRGDARIVHASALAAPKTRSRRQIRPLHESLTNKSRQRCVLRSGHSAALLRRMQLAREWAAKGGVERRRSCAELRPCYAQRARRSPSLLRLGRGGGCRRERGLLARPRRGLLRRLPCSRSPRSAARCRSVQRRDAEGEWYDELAQEASQPLYAALAIDRLAAPRPIARRRGPRHA